MLPFRSDGNILTMVAIGRDYILLTKELPLEKLCKQDRLTVGMLSSSTPIGLHLGYTALSLSFG